MIPGDESTTSSSIFEFYELVNDYNSIDEQELDMKIIFDDREKRNTRIFRFEDG